MVDVAKTEAAIRYFAQLCDWIDISHPVELAYIDTNRNVYAEPGISTDDTRLHSTIPGPAYIGRRTYYLGSGMISPYLLLGRFTSISHRVDIGSTNHRMDYLSTGRFPGMRPEALVEQNAQTNSAHRFTSIGCDVWIGVNVTILQGRSIGHGACIGAGSIVTHDIRPYAVAAGNPARVIRMRFPEALVQRLLQTRWWMQPDDVLETLPYQNVEACVSRLEELTAFRW